MHLIYLPANMAYVFVWGDGHLTRMGDAPMFHPTRASALAAAKACGLTVNADNEVAPCG